MRDHMAARGSRDARVRWAHPRDGPAIRGLYAGVYASGAAQDATENYPFPQLLAPGWLEDALEGSLVSWLVAEEGAGIVGAVGLLYGLGSADDRIAEALGLVVSARSGSRGLGTQLLHELCDFAAKEVCVVVGEMRTNHSAVARAVSRSALRPVGYEPFARTICGRAESLLAVAMVGPDALARRLRGLPLTPAAARLAAFVLEEAVPQPLPPAGELRTSSFDPAIAVRELDPATAAAGFAELERVAAVDAGFVDLRHMDELGARQPRRRQRYFGWTRRGELQACANVAHNAHDRHMRLERLLLRPSDVTLDATLRALLGILESEAGGSCCAVAAEILAERCELACGLEALGFGPSGYYPALVERSGRRMDVVQYMRWIGELPAEALPAEAKAAPAELGWPCADELVRIVRGGLGLA